MSPVTRRTHTCAITKVKVEKLSRLRYAGEVLIEEWLQLFIARTMVMVATIIRWMKERVSILRLVFEG